MAGEQRMDLRSSGVGRARGRLDAFSLRSAARAAVFVVVLTVPLSGFSSSKSLCEEFHRETMAMFVESVMAKHAAEPRGPDSVETAMLDRVLSLDCGVQRTPLP
jgi:hypothetical protein